MIESQPSLLLRLAHLEALYQTTYQFQAVELKEKAQRVDAALIPADDETGETPVIVAEFQFWAGKFIYTRLVNIKT